jgi:tetratricopeptide (TPR) repeat protein
MIPAPYERVKEVFAEALLLPEEEWPAFLDRVCAADTGLRQEVEALLAAHLEPDIAFDEVVAGAAADLVGATQTGAGREISPYRIVREIGRGGMGVVYEAVRDEFRQRVAIKLLPRGQQDAGMVERFRQERTILAGLEHPNIARLLDGGITDEGELYFVMEYIEGQSITDYCRTNKLTVIERLGLFAKVTKAVEYAHRNLVVHRDLKPGNILVASDGTPKLLDFGIAKLLHEHPAPVEPSTRTGVHLMTPEYASPEQVMGRAITTSTDIYSLGVVLYELLTGQRPFQLDRRMLQEVERIICQEEPTKPSTAVTAEGARTVGEARPDRLRRTLAGDLDNIVLMALRKEPQRRYSSVEQFTQDIRLYLEGRPVIARGDSAHYRMGKFVRRHKAVVAAASLAVISLAGGITVALREARIAQAERNTAEDLFGRLRTFSNAFLFEFDDAVARLPGSTPARRFIVEKALAYLDGLARQSGGNVELQREAAKGYVKVGDIQGNPYTPNLGDAAGAVASFDKAITISRTVAARLGTPSAQNELAEAILHSAGVLRTAGKTADALVRAREGLAIQEKALAAAPGDRTIRLAYLRGLQTASDLLDQSGDVTGALDTAVRSLSVAETLAAQDTPEMRRLRIAQQARVAAIELKLGRRDAAIERLRTGLQLAQRMSVAHAEDRELMKLVAFLEGKLGDALNRPGEAGAAIAHYHASIDISEGLAAMDPRDLQAQRNAALANAKLTAALYRAGKNEDGLLQSRKAARMFESITQTDPTNNLILLDLARTYLGSGLFLSALRKSEEAIAEYGRAADVLATVSAKDDGNSQVLIELSNTHLQIAKEYMVLARRQQARDAALRQWRSAEDHIRQCRKSLDEARKLALPADDAAMQQDIEEASRQTGESIRRLSEK